MEVMLSSRNKTPFRFYSLILFLNKSLGVYKRECITFGKAQIEAKCLSSLISPACEECMRRQDIYLVTF
jgi:hypothetical protein